MRTATTLAMITLLAVASAQVYASPASGDSSLTGVPMSAGKRLLITPVSSANSTATQTSGVPMYYAKRLLGPQVATPSYGAGASMVPLSGVTMARAKRPS